MPLLDRFWQARIALAAFLAFAAVAFAVRFLPIAYVVDQRRHIAFWPDALFTVGFCFGLLGLAVYYLLSVRLARARVQWRDNFLVGAGDAVSVRSPTYLSPEPQLTLPLTLTWGYSWYVRAIGALGYLISTLEALIAVLFAYGLIRALIRNDVAAFYSLAVLGASCGMFLLTMALIFVACYFGNMALECWRPTVAIIANEDGVTQRKGYSKRFIRWEDMRLLEVITYRPLNKRRHLPKDRLLLYGRDTVIAWEDVYSRQARYSQREELLAYIERRGRLRPRQFKQTKR